MESRAVDSVSEPNRLPKEIWILIFNFLRAERKFYPALNEVEFILPFLKLVDKRIYAAVKEYISTNKINEKSQTRRIGLMLILAEWGAISCIKLLREYGVKWSEGTCEMAARGGHFDLLKYARENGCLWNVSSTYKSMSVNAVMGGNMEILKYLRDQQCPLDTTTCDKAAECGRVEILKYLRSVGCPLSTETSKLAIKYGHVECVKYLHEVEKVVVLNSIVMDEAVDVEVMKYLRSVGAPWSIHSCNNAAKAGRADSLKYAHQNGAFFIPDCIKFAASSGQYECLKYLIESGAHVSVTPDMLCMILGGMYWNFPELTPRGKVPNMFKCFKYARENGAIFTHEVAREAAKAGALDCLAYAHEQGCPWDESVFIGAVRYNRLDCIKYAAEHGCPWSSNVFSKVVVQGNLETLQFVVKAGCPVDKQHIIKEIKDYGTTYYFDARKRIQAQLDYLKTVDIVINIDLAKVFKF